MSLEIGQPLGQQYHGFGGSLALYLWARNPSYTPQKQTQPVSSGHPLLQSAHLEKLRVDPGGPLQGYFAGAHDL